MQNNLYFRLILTIIKIALKLLPKSQKPNFVHICLVQAAFGEETWTDGHINSAFYTHCAKNAYKTDLQPLQF
jgi:hypothetical protein